MPTKTLATRDEPLTVVACFARALQPGWGGDRIILRLVWHLHLDCACACGRALDSLPTDHRLQQLARLLAPPTSYCSRMKAGSSVVSFLGLREILSFGVGLRTVWVTIAARVVCDWSSTGHNRYVVYWPNYRHICCFILILFHFIL